MNVVLLSGNLGADPEVVVSSNGNPVCKLRLATTERYLDGNKVQQERTNWHRVTVFGKRGESLGKILRKGERVNVQGRLEYGSYEKDGVKHYTTDIIAVDVELLGGKKATSSDTEADTTGSDELPLP